MSRLDPFRWLGSHELATLLLLLSVAAAIWAFAEISDLAMSGDSAPFDERLILTMRNADDLSDPIGPPWVEELGRDFTALGGVGVLTLLSLTVGAYLLLDGKVRALLLVAAAVVGGLIISSVLKNTFGRDRPDLVPHASVIYTASFPSGHSLMSAVTYLTLGALLARVQPRKRLKALLLLSAVLVTVLVGVSRVYLGVHWPTDVLAGWTLGAAWALACWLVARWLQRIGRLETDAET
jgi:undecaprenyl-diphosphatase